MNDEHRGLAIQVRSLLAEGRLSPARFRRAMMSVPPADRDAWLDLVLGINELADDGPDLPNGCVPYLPCGVDALLRMVEHAEVRANDVFVDVGSGLGRAAALTHFLTGAPAIAIEIQSDLVRSSRELTQRVNARVSVVQGDAVELTGCVTVGSVFFMYCPFSGDRLSKVLDDLESIARTRPIRLCCVDLPLPPRRWLTPLPLPYGDLAIYRSSSVSVSRVPNV